MDRRDRRLVLSTSSLEARQMLSVASTAVAAATGTTSLGSTYTAPAGVQVEGATPLQQTIEAKQQHIANLPYFIGLLERDGVVPQPTVQNIQNDLYSFVGGLHQSNPHDTASFNLDLRKAQPYSSFRPQDNARLNRDFGAVLVEAGVAPAVAADLQAQMNQLVDYNTAPGVTRSGSSITDTNDYATVLQLALGSGRPLVYPNVPALLSTDHNGNVGKVPVTHSQEPSLTGNYVYGTNIEIVDEANQVVLGTGAVNKNGAYQVKFTSPLANGEYVVRVRAQDSGYLSDPSPKFTFIVNYTPPKPKK